MFICLINIHSHLNTGSLVQLYNTIMYMYMSMYVHVHVHNNVVIISCTYGDYSVINNHFYEKETE